MDQLTYKCNTRDCKLAVRDQEVINSNNKKIHKKPDTPYKAQKNQLYPLEYSELSLSCSSLSIIENSVRVIGQKSSKQDQLQSRRKTSLEVQAEEIAYQNSSFFTEGHSIGHTLDTLKPSSTTSLKLTPDLQARGFLSQEDSLSFNKKAKDCHPSNLFFEDFSFSGNFKTKAQDALVREDDVIQEFFDSGSESGSSQFEGELILFEPRQKAGLKIPKKIQKHANPNINYQNKNSKFDFSLEWIRKITKREIEKVYICSQGNIVLKDESETSNVRDESTSLMVKEVQKRALKFKVEVTDENFGILKGEEKQFCDFFLENYKKVMNC